MFQAAKSQLLPCLPLNVYAPYWLAADIYHARRYQGVPCWSMRVFLADVIRSFERSGGHLINTQVERQIAGPLVEGASPRIIPAVRTGRDLPGRVTTRRPDGSFLLCREIAAGPLLRDRHLRGNQALSGITRAALVLV
jgi:hypothetical protein